MKPCKHGHVDGVIHTPCYQCESERLAKKLESYTPSVESEPVDEFNPDRDQLEACHASLREHMVATKVLIDGLQKITWDNSNCGTYNFVQGLIEKAQTVYTDSEPLYTIEQSKEILIKQGWTPPEGT